MNEWIRIVLELIMDFIVFFLTSTFQCVFLFRVSHDLFVVKLENANDP